MSEFQLVEEPVRFLYTLTAPPNITGFSPFYFCDIEGGAFYNNNTYQYIRYIEVEGLSENASGVDAEPTVTIGDNGTIGLWVTTYQNLLNFRLNIKRIKEKNLNNASGIYSTPGQTYRIAKKLNHIPNKVISFNLKPLATLNMNIPGRLVNTNCTWKRYRGEGCNYTGSAKFTVNNVATTDESLDVCALTMDACTLRGNLHNFSGVPTIDTF